MLRHILRRGSDPVVTLMALSLAVALYSLFWPIMVTDIALSYVPWLNHIAEIGPLRALGRPFGDYTPPYYYMLALVSPLVGTVEGGQIVKVVSLAGTLMLAGSVARLASTMRIARPLLMAGLTMILPGVALNTALMGQCDALSTAPLIMAVAAAIDRRHRAMFLWCGVAAAIKAQVVFCAPFFLAIALKRRVPVLDWLLAPSATLMMFLPALILGWPITDLLTIYFRQASFFADLSLNAPNVWAIVQALPISAPLTGLATAAAVGAAGCYVAHVVARPLPNRVLLAAAAFSPLIVAGLLPRMHERYFFAGDVLVFVWAAASRRGEDWFTAMLVQAGSLLGILALAMGVPQLAIAGAVAMIVATWRLAVVLLARPANDDGPLSTPSPFRVAPPAA